MFEPISPVEQRNARAAIEICVQLAATMSDPLRLCDEIIEQLQLTLGYERCAIVSRRKVGDPLSVVAHARSGPDAKGHRQEIRRVESLLNDGPPGVIANVIQTGRERLVEDVHGDPNYIEGAVFVRSELCVPIRRADKAIGAFNVECDQVGFFGRDDVLVMRIIAALLAAPLETIQSRQFDD